MWTHLKIIGSDRTVVTSELTFLIFLIKTEISEGYLLYPLIKNASSNVLMSAKVMTF